MFPKRVNPAHNHEIIWKIPSVVPIQPTFTYTSVEI